MDELHRLYFIKLVLLGFTVFFFFYVKRIPVPSLIPQCSPSLYDKYLYRSLGQSALGVFGSIVVPHSLTIVVKHFSSSLSLSYFFYHLFVTFLV